MSSYTFSLLYLDILGEQSIKKFLYLDLKTKKMNIFLCKKFIYLLIRKTETF